MFELFEEHKLIVFLFLLYCCSAIGVMEYIKYIMKQNLKKEIFFVIKDRVLPFYPLIMALLGSFILRIKLLENPTYNFIFNFICYVACLNVIFQVIYKTTMYWLKKALPNILNNIFNAKGERRPE